MNAYQKHKFLPWRNERSLLVHDTGPDRRSGAVHLFDPDLKLAAEIAIVTRRPLLLRGDPGCGKSSFAAFVARNLRWRYYEFTITRRTEARDLLWRFDALSRLHDANLNKPGVSVAAEKYISPSILWWAFNRRDALDFLAARNAIRATEEPEKQKSSKIAPAKKLGQSDEQSEEPFAAENKRRDKDRAVVLIDEIDKAEPDLPNDLLEAFGMNTFTVEEINRRVPRQVAKQSKREPSCNKFGDLLMIVTTNQERDLPQAFLRRCVVHTIEEPKDRAAAIKRLLEIAKLHFKRLPTIALGVAEKVVDLRIEARKRSLRAPSTAEFLDALLTCQELGLSAQSDLWQHVQRSLLLKDASWDRDH